jgi:hypothetical protein
MFFDADSSARPLPNRRQLEALDQHFEAERRRSR